MTRILLTIALAASVVAGCDTTDTTGPVTYTSNDLTYVEPDECDFFINNEELVAVVTVLGSTVTMVVQSVTTRIRSSRFRPTTTIRCKTT